MRTSLPDRPGALALLAEQCGLAEINILGLQIFPGVGSVTDELVLRAPADWGPGQIVALVESSGGRSVQVFGCTEAALTDQPTRYVQAARAILDRPLAFPEVVARLDPAWQRRGIDARLLVDVARLLVDVARLAQARGAEEVLLSTGSDNQAVLPMVLSAGLRGRIRMAGDELTVRVPVRDLRPLRA